MILCDIAHIYRNLTEHYQLTTHISSQVIFVSVVLYIMQILKDTIVIIHLKSDEYWFSSSHFKSFQFSSNLKQNIVHCLIQNMGKIWKMVTLYLT